jgi:hypothetical protein
MYAWNRELSFQTAYVSDVIVSHVKHQNQLVTSFRVQYKFTAIWIIRGSHAILCIYYNVCNILRANSSVRLLRMGPMALSWFGVEVSGNHVDVADGRFLKFTLRNNINSSGEINVLSALRRTITFLRCTRDPKLINQLPSFMTQNTSNWVEIRRQKFLQSPSTKDDYVIPSRGACGMRILLKVE